MVEMFDGWIREVGPAAYALLFLASLVEYVFPPFPGDSLVLLGGVYAVRGEKPWGLVFLAVTAGSIVGSYFDYRVGKTLAEKVEANAAHGWWGEMAKQLHGLQARMRKRATLLLLVNRFLPGIRALIFLSAGASGLPLARTLVLGAVSAAVWNVLLMGVGIAVGGNAEKLEGLVAQYSMLVWGAALFAAIVIVARWAYGRKKVTV